MKFTDLLGAFTGGQARGRSHLKNLIEMANADGHLHEAELELIKTVAKRHGISEEQLADIRKNLAKIQFEMPSDPRERFHQLFDLVQLMGIDKKIHTSEAELARLFAIRFGYKKEIAGELVEIISENIKNGNSVDEAMKRTQLILR